MAVAAPVTRQDVRKTSVGPVQRTGVVEKTRFVMQSQDEAVDLEGHLSPQADAAQMAFEIHGLILALHYEARFLNNPGSLDRANTGFAHILARYGCGDRNAAAAKPTKAH